MPDVIVEIFTPRGAKVGKFVNPKVEMVPNHYYSISGQFTDENGQVPDRIEFNPEALPYTADITGATKCTHKKIIRVYVQRGRQPIEMIGVCQV